VIQLGSRRRRTRQARSGPVQRGSDQHVVQWLRQLSHNLGNQCLNQSIYLAAAGILAGQDATTHWA